MATGATEFIDATTADALFPEIWSRHLTIAREEALVFAKLVDRKFEKEMSFGDRVNITPIAHLAARTKSRTTNDAITFETETPSNVTITIATWEYAAFAMEEATKKQTQADMVAAYTPEMAYALSVAIDTVVAGYPDDAAAAYTVGTLSQSLTHDDLLEANRILDDANVPQEDRFMVISPAQEEGFLKLQQFVNADFKSLVPGSSAKNAKDRAYVNSWRGIPIYKSTNVEGTNASGHDNTLMHKTAIALIVQLKATARHQYDINYFADKYATHNLYGSGLVRTDHMVFLRGA